MRTSAIRRHACRIVLAVPLGLTCMAHAQTPAALPNVELIDLGEIQSMVEQPHYGVVVAGGFTHIEGIARNGLARINGPNLDAGWNPNPSWLSATPSIPRRVTMAPDGGIFVSGDLVEIAGHAVDCIAKLKPNGELDTSWSAPTTNCDFDPVFDRRGWMYYVDSDQVVRRARLDIGGSADGSWEYRPQAFGVVPYKLLMEFSSSLYVASLDPFNGQTRVAQVAVANGLERWGRSDFQGTVVAMQQGEDSTLFAAYADGSIRTFDVRYGSVATLQQAQGSNLRDIKLFEQGWQQLLLVADANGVHTIDARSGQPVSSYPVAAGGKVNQVLARESSFFAGGKFSGLGGMQTQSLALYGGNGNPGPGPSYEVQGLGQVAEVVMQSNGGAIVRGSFVKADRLPRKDIFRLTPQGQVDPGWSVEVDGAVKQVVVGSNSAVYIGGQFSRVNMVLIDRVAKLGAATGQVVENWRPYPGPGELKALEIDAQDRIYLAMTQLPWQRTTITRAVGELGDIDSNWSLDGDSAGQFEGLTVLGESLYLRGRMGSDVELSAYSLANGLGYEWNARAFSATPVPARIDVVAKDSLGRIVLGGRFGSFSGSNSKHLVRLLPGQWPIVDGSWAPQIDGAVRDVDFDANGEVYIAGEFSHVNGQPNPGLAKLSPADGTLRSEWSPQHGAQSICVADAQRLFVIGDAWRNTLVALPLTVSLSGDAPGAGPK